MIARIWGGATRARDAEPYLEYLHRTGLAEYRATPGNLGVLALRSVDAERDRAQFLLVTLWESEQAIRRFAGDTPLRAVFYPEDERYLVERDEQVRHFEVVHAEGLEALLSGALARR
jgi:heme-degrading monooxygenase HmoA